MPGEGGNLKQIEGDENERNPRGEKSELYRHFQRASAGQGVVAEGEGAAVPDPESAGELAVQCERVGCHHEGGEDRSHVRPAGAGAGGVSDPASAARDAGKDGTQRIRDELPENRIGWCIKLMLGTGMRTQELLALEPRHIAEDGSLIQIRQAINMDKGKAKIGTPKSEDSYRDVPVPENVRYCARLLRDGAGTYIWDGKVPGTPVNPSTFRHNYTKALQSLETVRVLSPHSCRHTYVSQMRS